jgi:hypothetical protein
MVSNMGTKTSNRRIPANVCLIPSSRCVIRELSTARTTVTAQQIDDQLAAGALTSAHVSYSAWRGVPSPPPNPPSPPMQTRACHKPRPLNTSHAHVYSMTKVVSPTPPATIAHTRLLGCAGRRIYAVQVRHLAEKLVDGIHKLIVVRCINLHTRGCRGVGCAAALESSRGQRYQTTTFLYERWSSSALAMGSQVCAGDEALGQPTPHKHLHMPMMIQVKHAAWAPAS